MVFDSSTLILLAKSELLDLFLDDFRGPILVPLAVEAECTGHGHPDAVLIQHRIREGRVVVEEVRHPQVVVRLIQDFRLGPGEAEALALALDRGGDDAVIATDDRNAIRACKVLRIGFVTSLGILVRSVEKALLSPEDAKRILDRLVIYGRLRKDVVEEARRQIGDATHGESSKNR